MREATRKFLFDAGERLVKSFFQGYFTTWFLVAGIGSSMGNPDAAAFDTLFTANNLKGGAVMAALSFFTSVVSKPVGDDSSASLVQ